jgi:hypothetical protein
MSVSIRTRALTALLPALLSTALSASAQTESAAARITALQRAGRVAEALALCRQENTLRPGDPVMLYNQACLESRTGDVPTAMRSLRASLAAGFDDFDFALSDPDLQGAAVEGVKLAIAERRQRRGALSDARGARLALGRPAVMPLESSDGALDADRTTRLTVTWQMIGLALRLEADDSGRRYLPEGDARPWLGEAGVVVALGDLAGGGTGETADCFLFGFGREKNAGVGALFVVETGRWQRVRELEPKFRGIGTAQMVMDVTIPWSAIAPYHPLVDRELGLNAALHGPGGVPGPRLMPAEMLNRPASPHQWAARLDFDLATAAPGVLQGRTPATIVTGDTVALNLAAVSDRAGEGTLTVDFRDSEGQSLLAAGPSAQPVPLNAGLNAINRAVDFSRLRSGPCRISATLTFPSGEAADWSAWLLHLEPGWEAGTRAALAGLPADEQRTANHYLTAAIEAVRTHRARRNPGALTTTIGDLNLMLACFRQTGSLVPTEGLTAFVYPGPDGTDRLCHLVVPAGRPTGAALAPVLLAGHAAADAPRLASRILRFFAEANPGPIDPETPDLDQPNSDKPNSGKSPAPASALWPVFVVAPGATDNGAKPAAAQAESRSADDRELLACVRWARERFGGGKLQVAVQRRAVAPGLALASGPDAPIGRLLVFADGTLEPWPGATAADLALRVGAAPGGLTVTWVDFTMETATAGQAIALRNALLGAGWRLETETVRGSASFTQIADRTCQWQARGSDTPTPAR